MLDKSKTNEQAAGRSHSSTRALRMFAAVLMAAFALVGCLMLGACSKSSSSTSSSSTQTASTASAQQAKYAVTIDGASMGTDYDGNNVIIVSYTFTNNAEKATSPAGAVINKVYQNSVELSSAYVVSGMDSDGYTKNVKTGGTVSYQEAYVLDDSSTVSVESTELASLSDDLLASATFEVQ